jgi:hypothetical protein
VRHRHSDARLAGHNSGLADVGVLPDPDLVCAGEPTAQFGYRAAGELLDLRIPGDLAARAGPGPGRRYFRICRAITTRWIWFVPS